jgi:peptide deformylase
VALIKLMLLQNIKTESNEKIIDLEGSVNLPNVFGEVERSKMITVEDVNHSNTLTYTNLWR